MLMLFQVLHRRQSKIVFKTALQAAIAHTDSLCELAHGDLFVGVSLEVFFRLLDVPGQQLRLVRPPTGLASDCAADCATGSESAAFPAVALSPVAASWDRYCAALPPHN